MVDMRIRTVPTASGKHAVQVVSKNYGKVTVHKHIGSFSTHEERSVLIDKADAYIRQITGQLSLMEVISPAFHPSEIAVSQNRPLFVYRFLSSAYDKLGFNTLPDELIKDLVIARIYAPSSKRETREILSELFDRHWSLTTIYRHVKKGMENGLKENFQNALIHFAKETLHDPLRLVFYDVTTLYFESTRKDILRDFGFSKEHRASEVQVVIGLLVNSQGFPLYYDVFSGKTFEGNTFIPMIEALQRLISSTDLVVIADSAMLSLDNMQKLHERRIGFVVGARMANLPLKLINEIHENLQKEDNKTTTVQYHDHRLICQYSTKRAYKDRSDRTKQVEKVQSVIIHPSAATSRYRFMKTDGGQYSLNTDLLEKAEKLEGIKGYMTNTDLSESVVIERYHDLWHVENAFRFTKADLEARPVFHRLEDTIKAHLTIVFAGLAISRYIELQTGMTMRKVLKYASNVLTHKVTNVKSGESAYVETTIEDQTVREKIEMLKALGY